MIGVIVISHNDVAKEMVRCCETIVGKMECLETISFYSDEHLADLEDKFNQAIERLNCCNGILVLIDMFGGSPSNIAITGLKSRPEMEIISGFNVPMLLELISRESITDIVELKEKLLNRAKSGIIDIKGLISKRMG
ncbi:MAG: PTS sugar transporter subunit IIA [bacterium]|nr:PTS sugar transporter subunit IIA [bacterium]